LKNVPLFHKNILTVLFFAKKSQGKSFFPVNLFLTGLCLYKDKGVFMREPILKAVAMPPRVFWAPLLPAALNFAVQSGLMAMYMAAYRGNPLWFLGSVVIVHAIIVVYASREPHLSNMIQSQGIVTTANKKIYPDKGTKLAP